jgi:hypothetical protein
MGILSDGVNIGTTIYDTIEQPHVERGFLRNAEHAFGIASDAANIAGTVYSMTQQP